MPIVGGGTTTYLSLLPVAPTATESATTFPTTASGFFVALYLMVENVNLTIGTSAPNLTELPAPPNTYASDFADAGDTFLASLPGMVTGVNNIISTLSLPCSPITALPTAPSRGSDPTNFATLAAAFVAALTTLRTQLNAFITALIAYNPNSTLFDGTGVHWDSTTHTWDAG